MRSLVSRRKLLAGAAAVAITVPGTQAVAVDPLGVAAVEPDAGLLRLKPMFAQAFAAYEAARTRFNQCERRFFDLCPRAPGALTGNSALGRLSRWEHWSAAELRSILKNSKRRHVWSKARAALVLAKKYEAAVRGAERDSGSAVAEAEFNAATDRLGTVSQSILDASARSFADFAFKAHVVKTWGHPEWWDPVADRADTYERLAAQILDVVIATSERDEAGECSPLSATSLKAPQSQTPFRIMRARLY